MQGTVEAYVAAMHDRISLQSRTHALHAFVDFVRTCTHLHPPDQRSACLQICQDSRSMLDVGLPWVLLHQTVGYKGNTHLATQAALAQGGIVAHCSCGLTSGPVPQEVSSQRDLLVHLHRARTSPGSARLGLHAAALLNSSTASSNSSTRCIRAAQHMMGKSCPSHARMHVVRR